MKCGKYNTYQLQITTARLEAGVITEVDDYMLPLSNQYPNVTICQRKYEQHKQATKNKYVQHDKDTKSTRAVL